MAFRGRVALVTGAASGMGRVAARRLSQAGARVAAVDLNEEGLLETGRGLDGFHGHAVDVSDAPSVRELVERVEDDLGPIDRAVNAAAIMPTGLLADMDADQVRRVMDVNYSGTVNVSLAVLPRMLARGSGDLVNFASIAGWVPNLHFGAYDASKFAVVAFTEVLHHENRGRGVRILCVCPGKVQTPLLEQAKSDPRILQLGAKPIAPERVIDGIEPALEKGRVFVFSDWQTRTGWWMRRLAPWLMWWIDHRAEGF